MRLHHFVSMALAATCSANLSYAADLSNDDRHEVRETAPSTEDGWWASWERRARLAEESQPHWITPLVTGTPLLEQQFRYDQRWEILPNGAHLNSYDGGKGLELIPTVSNQVTINAPPYQDREAKKVDREGFGDWPVLNVKQRLFSEDERHGNYVLTAALGAQAPTGVNGFTNEAWVITPSIAGGIGWGPMDVQATVGSPLPMRRASTIGWALVGNAALQYHVLTYLWPEFEVNATHWLDGQRRAKTQTFLTPGLMIGHMALWGGRAGLVVGAGYQFAVSPDQTTRPVDTPTYNHAWIGSGRIAF